MQISLEDRLHGLLSRYIAAPQWAKSVLGTVYQSLPANLRRGRAYDGFLALARRRDSTSLAQFAVEQLRATLDWASQTVPAYRHLQGLAMHEGDPAAWLAEFPLTGKTDIKSDLGRFLSTATPPSKRLAAFTGGSTSEPMAFFLEKDATRAREYAFMDDFHDRVGYREGEVVLALRGRVVPTAAKPGGPLWMFEPIKRQLILSSDHLEAPWMQQYMEALGRWRPRFIQAFPSALYPLARWLRDNPLPEFTEGVQGLMLYSENVYGYQLQLFREVFGCPVLCHYGHSERVLMAASMPDDDRLFFWPQYGWLELVDHAGRPVTTSGAVGEIVGTSFHNKVMPFVRYRTSDLAVVSSGGEHPLLPGWPVVERIEGRLQEFVVCRDGRLISICTLGAAHFQELAEVEALQYEQREPGHLILRVVAPRGLKRESKARIARAVEDKTQQGCTAEVVEVDRIPRTPRGKHVMLLQHINLHGYLGASSDEDEDVAGEEQL